MKPGNPHGKAGGSDNSAALEGVVGVVRQLYLGGRAREARVVADNALRHAPPGRASAELMNLAGACALKLGDGSAAERYFRQSMQCQPGLPEAPANLAVVLAQSGRPAEAAAMLAEVVRLRPGNHKAHADRIMLLMQLGRPAEVAAACRQFLAEKPDNPGICNTLGLALYQQGLNAEAIAAFRQALALNPRFAEAENNLGSVLMAAGDLAAAEAAFGHALELAQHHADTLHNLGHLRMRQQRPDEAEALYRRITTEFPQYVAAWMSLGTLLDQAARPESAEAALRQALVLAPGNAGYWSQLAAFLHRQGRGSAAVEALRQVSALRPHSKAALLELITASRYIADWQELGAREAQLLQGFEQEALGAFHLLPIPALTPEQHCGAARRLVESLAGAELSAPPLSQRRAEPRARLRISYLSADFHNHPTVYLLAGVLEQHDPAAVEVFLHSYGPPSDSPERQRLVQSGVVFRDLHADDDATAAQKIADDGIDILVDIKGYTVQYRPGISARHPAPVTVNWLGYPGSLGHPRMADYLIGDPIVSPLHHAGHFSETLALLPNSYQANDRHRRIDPAPSRSAAGLPEQGFVFCCFNQPYKIRPETFAQWCRLLAAVPGSVLWLWQHKYADVKENLRAAAASHGIAPERLVFAESLPLAAHLGRLQLADLALDTFPVCSHTTASDALWAGVPLVTRMGETFVSRVAGSLLHAAGLPELVTENDEDCFKLALELATDPTRLAALRQRLQAQRLSCPLFDTARFTRDLEALYQRIWAQECAGQRAPLDAMS